MVRPPLAVESTLVMPANAITRAVTAVTDATISGIGTLARFTAATDRIKTATERATSVTDMAAIFFGSLVYLSMAARPPTSAARATPTAVVDTATSFSGMSDRRKIEPARIAMDFATLIRALDLILDS